MLRALLVAAFLLAAQNTNALAASLEGTWMGAGYLQPASGKRAPVTCKVQYQPASEAIHTVTATCSAGPLTIVQTGKVKAVSDGRFVGNFSNSTHQVAGSVRVTVSGSAQQVVFKGAAGEGALALKKQ